MRLATAIESETIRAARSIASAFHCTDTLSDRRQLLTTGAARKVCGASTACLCSAHLCCCSIEHCCTRSEAKPPDYSARLAWRHPCHSAGSLLKHHV